MARLRETTSACAATFAVMVSLACVGHTHGAVWFDDFSNTDGLTLNESTTVDNGIDPDPVLRLAAATADDRGSAFTTQTMDIAGFSTWFTFRISDSGGVADINGEGGGDGLTFTIQPNGPNAIGNGGGDLGYGTITPSIAVELDTWNNDPIGYPQVGDPDSNHIGVDVNGSLSSEVTAAAPGQFDDGTLRSALITYDGTTLTTQSGGTLLSYNVDIPSLLGTDSAYVGLTASTGGAVGNHDIVSWHFAPVPEPTAFAVWLVLGMAITGASWWRRRRTS